MSTAQYTCAESSSGPFFSLTHPSPSSTNVTLDDTIMQAGAAHHKYVSPLLAEPNPFTDAELFSGEEIVLGILSLFIISLISSLVYDVLLRAGHNKAYSTRAISVAAALESFERWGFHPKPLLCGRRKSSDDDSQPRLWFKGILVVLVLAAATFSMEVALIAATQEVDVSTTGEQIGFELFTPVVANWGMGQFLRRNAPTRPCVTPTLSGASKEWKARVQTCLNVNYGDDVIRNEPYSGRMRYRSVYHRRGSDHFLAALDRKLTYSLSIRTKIYREDAGPAEILRSPIPEERNTALLVHLTAPIYFNTNINRSRNKTCAEAQLSPLVYDFFVGKEEVIVGQSENGPRMENGTVYTTEFDLEVDDIHWWIVHGLGSAAASAGIGLTEDPRYLTGRNALPIKLSNVVYITKQRRFAAPTMGVVLVVLLSVKLLVRRFLNPLSLFEVARIKAMEAAGIDPNRGMRDQHGSVRIDMDRNGYGLSALYCGPADDPAQCDITYEEAGSFYVSSTKK